MKAEKLDGRSAVAGAASALSHHSRLCHAGQGRRDAILRHRARASRLALATPALLARMQLLPAERMLAAVEPGYSAFSVTGLARQRNLQQRIACASFGHSADAPAGVVYGDLLADLYYDAPPVKEFRKKYKLTKLGGTKSLLTRDSQGLQGIRRQAEEAAHRHCRIPPAVPARRLERIRAAGRVLHARRLPDRSRLAGAARISQRRAAPRRVQSSTSCTAASSCRNSWCASI